MKWISLLLIIFTPDVFAALEGWVLEKGTKKPLSNVSVFLLPYKTKAITDSNGRFYFDPEISPELRELGSGAIQWVINAPGYERLDRDEIGPINLNASRTFYLERQSYLVFETVVIDQQKKKDESTRTLKAKEATGLPGSGGDPIRAVQNFPGVARSFGLSSQVVIQGSAPEDTRYLIDGHEVPIIFHFAGFSSVVTPEALDRIDFLSAGYGAEYGRALGGLVGVWSREPDRQRVKGFAFVDLANSGAAIEAPINEKSGVFFGFRKSYIGNVLEKVAKSDDDFALTAAPSFDDATFVYNLNVSDKDKFKLISVGSQDSLKFILKEGFNNDPEARGNFENRTAFFRVIPQWEHKHSEQTKSRFSLGLGRDFIKFKLADDFFDLKTLIVTNRYELERKMTSAWTLRAGLDQRWAWADVSLAAPDFYNPGGVANPTASSRRQELNLRGVGSNNLGAYAIGEINLSKWTLRPAVRHDYFSQIHAHAFSPRFSANYAATPFRSYRLGTGLYHQPPPEEQTGPGYGNPNLKAPRALQLSVKWEEDLRHGNTRGWLSTLGPYWRESYQLVDPSTRLIEKDGTTQPINYENTGRARAFGMEWWLKGFFAPWNFWLSYTLARSERQSPEGRYRAEFDQTHLLALLSGYDFGRNWRVSGRLRYVTGNPITPVSGAVFDADNDSYIPIRGPFYSQRVQAFYQLDIRLDKKWIYDKWILNFYLDLQNATNHRNVENVNYAYDYSKRTDVMGLPMLPIFGLKGEF